MKECWEGNLSWDYKLWRIWVLISDIRDKISRNLQRSEDCKDLASGINEKSLLKLDLNQPLGALN